MKQISKGNSVLSSIDDMIFRFLVLGVFVLCLTSCESKTDDLQFNLFSSSELSEFSINQDSAMLLQTNVVNQLSHNGSAQYNYSYTEMDTVDFTSDSGDTISFQTIDGILIGVSADIFGNDNMSICLSASLIALESCFMKESGYNNTKSSRQKIMGQVNRHIAFTRLNNPYDKDINYDLPSSDFNKNVNVGFVATYEPYNWKGVTIDSCLIVKQYSASSEVFSMIYSKHVGFLYIKDYNHYILRL